MMTYEYKEEMPFCLSVSCPTYETCTDSCTLVTHAGNHNNIIKDMNWYSICLLTELKKKTIF